MEQRIYTVKPMLVTLFIYALLLFSANLFFALNGNLLTWSMVRAYYHETVFFMLYGIATTIFIFFEIRENGKGYWGHVLMGLVFVLSIFSAYYFEYIRFSSFGWFVFKHFPIAIYCYFVVYKKKLIHIYDNEKSISPYKFFIFAMSTGGCYLAGALLWIIMTTGIERDYWTVFVLESTRLLVCCLAMYTIYKSTYSFETNKNLEIKLPFALKAWFVLCILIHLFLTLTCWKNLYYPELNGVILHLGTVAGLIVLLFNKKIGWYLFCIPLIILLLAQSRILINHLILPLPTTDQPFFWTWYGYFGYYESTILFAELIIAWFFIKYKQIKQ